MSDSIRQDAAQRRTRVAAYALCTDENDRILLVRIAPGYPGAGHWTLPGGGLHFGEDPALGALRELTEETGLVGRIDGLAFVHSFLHSQAGESGPSEMHGIRIVYRSAIVGGVLHHEQDESSDRAAWVPLDQAHELPQVDLVRVALDFLASG